MYCNILIVLQDPAMTKIFLIFKYFYITKTSRHRSFLRSDAQLLCFLLILSTRHVKLPNNNDNNNNNNNNNDYITVSHSSTFLLFLFLFYMQAFLQQRLTFRLNG